MKNNKLIVMGFVLALTMTLVADAAFAARVQRKAEVTSLNGTVEWLKSGAAETDWQTVGAGQKLGTGDKIRTGELSSAVLTLDEGSTLTLSAGAEFVIQSLSRESNTGDTESLMAILKGQVIADVTPMTKDSAFEIASPSFAAVVHGTVLTVGVNPDGSAYASSSTGDVSLVGEGLNAYTAHLDDGKEALIQVDPITGDVTITAIKGAFDVQVTDGTYVTLEEGDSVVISGGAATFIPLLSALNDPLGGNLLAEPPSGG